MKKIIVFLAAACLVMSCNYTNSGTAPSGTASSGNQSGSTLSKWEMKWKMFEKKLDMKIALAEAKKAEKAMKEEQHLPDYPAFRPYFVKRSLRYEDMINGKENVIASFTVGTFKADNAKAAYYAKLAEAGLVKVSSKAVLGSDGKYTNWINVQITPAAEKYLCSGYSVKTLPSTFASQQEACDFVNPAQDRNEYGELFYQVPADTIVSVIKAFYGDYVKDAGAAVAKYCEAEFVDAFNRLTKIDEYLGVLNMPANIQPSMFSNGINSANETISVCKVAEYNNCYKVSFGTDASVLLIMTSNLNNPQIFDLVLNEYSNTTLRTTNKQWTNAKIDEIAKMAEKISKAKDDKKESSKIEADRNWWAPGLVYAEFGGILAEDAAAASASSRTVSVLLYKNVIDRVYDAEMTYSYNEQSRQMVYNAVCKIVRKKVDFTPFQAAFQNLGLVEPVTSNSLYSTETSNLQYYDDCGWNFIR